jgi:hypothetical protein
VAFSAPGFAANYPLEVVAPRAAGTSPTSGQPAISGNHRIFWAYPGIQYNIRAAVIGGAYPYTFALSNSPTGMTVNSTTGEVIWTSPPVGATVTPTITVTDTEGTTVSTTWTVTVDPSRFIFLDSVSGREFDAAVTGTGTLANPFRRIRDLFQGDVYESKRLNAHVNKIAYFREGTYFIDGYLEDPGTLSLGRMAVLDGFKPVAWLAYPGETPTIDGQCFSDSPQIGTRPCNGSAHITFYDTGNNTYIDGFRVINMAYHGFRVAGLGNYQTFRRNHFSRLGPTERSVNESWITTIYSGGSAMGSYMTIQDNIFEDLDRGACIKLYSTQRILIEDNICRTGFDSTGGADTEGIAIKGGTMDRVTVRHNTIYNITQKGIGGNMNTLLSAEILFNRVYNVNNVGNHMSPINYFGTAVDLNQDGVARTIYIYRNTFVGKISVRNTDSSDGPFNFQTNVIINDEPGNHLYLENVSDTSRIQFSTNNLVGTASQNIVGPNLTLTDAYSSFVGTRGFQIGPTPTISPPRNLRVQ